MIELEFTLQVGSSSFASNVTVIFVPGPKLPTDVIFEGSEPINLFVTE